MEEGPITTFILHLYLHVCLGVRVGEITSNILVYHISGSESLEQQRNRYFSASFSARPFHSSIPLFLSSLSPFAPHSLIPIVIPQPRRQSKQTIHPQTPRQQLTPRPLTPQIIPFLPQHSLFDCQPREVEGATTRHCPSPPRWCVRAAWDLDWWLYERW